MITVSKFGTFWIAYCPECSWREALASWQEAEHLRAGHVCAREQTVRIELVVARRERALVKL